MQVLARLELCKQLHSNKSHLYFIWFLYDAVVSPSLQRMSPNSISWAHNNIRCQSSTKIFGSGFWRSWNWLLKLPGSPLIPPVQDAFWLVIFLSSKTWSLHYSWVFSTFPTYLITSCIAMYQIPPLDSKENKPGVFSLSRIPVIFACEKYLLTQPVCLILMHG